MSGLHAKKRKPRKPAAFVPHPDDVDDVRAALAELERGEGAALTREETRAYVHWLETGDAPEELRQLFEIGERRCRPASRS